MTPDLIPCCHPLRGGRRCTKPAGHDPNHEAGWAEAIRTGRVVLRETGASR